MSRRVLPARPELKRSYEVVIVGGGVHGLSLAYNLAKEGRTSVAVLERSYVGAGASGRNLSLIRSSWQQPAWIRLVWYARELWRTISVELDYNVMFTERGSFLCFGRTSPLEVVKAAVATQNEIGVPTRFVTADELARSVPQLDVERIVGAVHDPTAGISRHDALVWGYARAAAELGVDIHPATEVTGMTLEGDRVGAVVTDRGTIATEVVVNCAGSSSDAVGAMAGVEVPTRRLTLEMFVTEPYKAFLDPIITVAEDQAYFMQTSRGEFVGGAEPIGNFAAPRLATSYQALRQSAATLARLVPRLGGVNVLRAWGGLIDTTPDAAGLIGEVEHRPGFYLDCGWGAEGYMVSPATGRLGARYINTGVLDDRLAPFHHRRFETGETIDDSLIVADAAGEAWGGHAGDAAA